MPLAPAAAKGVLLLTPVVLAAGYAIYDSHEPFRNFVDEQWRKWKAFAEEQGWNARRNERQREETPFIGRLWDTTNKLGNECITSPHTMLRQDKAANGVTGSEYEIAHSTAFNGTRIAGSGEMPHRRTVAASEMEEMNRATSLVQAEHAAHRRMPGAQLHNETLSRLATSAAMQPAPFDVDALSEYSSLGAGAILTPTTEEGSIFGEETVGQESDGGIDGSDTRSATTEAAADADVDMLSSLSSSSIYMSRLDREDSASTTSSWNEIGPYSQ